MERLSRLSWGALGAGLIAMSFPRAGCWPLGWVCLVPLFVCLNAGAEGWEAALAGYAAGWAFSATAFFWTFGTWRHAHHSILDASCVLACLSALAAVNWAAAAFLGCRLTHRAPRGLRPWIWAGAFTAVTFASEHWTPRIPADMLAYTQWANLSLVQCAAWGGPHLLGFVVFLVNAALAEAWSDDSGPAAASLALATAIAVGLWAHGEMVLLERPSDLGATARVEILQPNIDQYAKWDLSFGQSIVDTLYELLAAAGSAPPSLVVWPETTIPRQVPIDHAVAEAVVWAKRLGAPQLVGVLSRPVGSGGPANAAQFVAPDGRLTGLYLKRELVPFGEFFPLRRFIPRFVSDGWLKDLDNFGDMTAGGLNQPLMNTVFGPTAVTICYEATFPRWSRLDAARGARLLVNLSNDGWYPGTWGPDQHFEMNVFRAVENRITVVRCANTGISGVIDPWGVVTARLPSDVRGRLDADLALIDPFPRRSFYTRHGDWFGTLCLIMTALGFLFSFARSDSTGEEKRA